MLVLLAGLGPTASIGLTSKSVVTQNNPSTFHKKKIIKKHKPSYGLTLNIYPKVI
jgi:hypothetical protein